MEVTRGEILMYLLDTDVLSQTYKDRPVEWVIRWLAETPQEKIFLSAITLQELQEGIDLMAKGRRRAALLAWMNGFVIAGFAGQILPVEGEVALECGRLMAKTKLAGHTAEVRDAFIAATAHVHGLVVATLNVKHYSRLDVALVKPLSSPGR